MRKKGLALFIGLGTTVLSLVSDPISARSEYSTSSGMIFASTGGRRTSADDNARQFVLTGAQDVAPEILRGDRDTIEEMELRDELSAPPARNEMSVPPTSVEGICDALAVSAEEKGLPLPFFANLIWQESRFDTRAVSRAGAQGIAQFMPATAVMAGLKDPFDPFEAIPASARLLHQLHQRFGQHRLGGRSIQCRS